MPRIDGEEAQSRVASGAVLVDVRSAGEFAAGHLPGAVNLPLPVDVQALEQGVPVVVYCRSGARSGHAAKALAAAGFDVADLGPQHRWSGELPVTALVLPLFLSFTLGLAPFSPPHLIGKLQWVAGGGVGMGWMDIGDLLMHGAPWVWLALTSARILLSWRRRS